MNDMQFFLNNIKYKGKAKKIPINKPDELTAIREDDNNPQIYINFSFLLYNNSLVTNKIKDMITYFQIFPINANDIFQYRLFKNNIIKKAKKKPKDTFEKKRFKITYILSVKQYKYII